MRRISFTVLLVTICLLPVGIGNGASAHSHAVATLDGALANTAAAQAQVPEDYFSRARSIDLLTANTPAFQDSYALAGSRAAKVRRGGPVLDKANAALGYLEELFPDSIGEACFIDRNSPENARMVRGVRATLGYPDGLVGDQIPLGGAGDRRVRRLHGHDLPPTLCAPAHRAPRHWLSSARAPAASSTPRWWTPSPSWRSS